MLHLDAGPIIRLTAAAVGDTWINIAYVQNAPPSISHFRPACALCLHNGTAFSCIGDGSMQECMCYDSVTSAIAQTGATACTCKYASMVEPLILQKRQTPWQW